MGRVRSSAAGGHRAGPLKQANKKHKTGRHRSKGVQDVETRGRVSSTSTSISKKGSTTRFQRKKQAATERLKKMSIVQEKKRGEGGGRGAPITIALIPLSPTTNINFTLKYLLSNLPPGTVVSSSSSSTWIKLASGKNLLLLSPPSGDIWSLLDTLKQADVALFLLPLLEPLSPEGWTLLQTAKEQGLPTPFIAVSSSFSKAEEKAWLKGMNKVVKFDKIFPLVSPSTVGHLLRMMSVSKITVGKGWGLRSSMFIESFVHHHAIEEEALHENARREENLRDLLEVRGIVRRKNLNPYRPVMIAGAGIYRILRIDVSPLEVPKELISSEMVKKSKGEEDPIHLLPPRFLYDPNNIPKEEEDEAVENQVEDEEMGSDIDALFEDDFEGESEMSVEDRKKKLPKGTSDYQADWLGDDDDDDNELIGSDEELETEEEGGAQDDDEASSEEMDWEEEKRQLIISKEAKIESEFPDWVDTPLETPARIRFQKYRGLQSFKTSSWDANENLPKEYSKIFQFKNFKHVYKMVTSEKEGDGPGFIPIGQRITMLLQPLEPLAGGGGRTVGGGKMVSLVSLLRHETRFSVLNIQLNMKQATKNKEQLIFQMGHHRFTASPVLSEISPGNKHKMLRYAQSGQTCMATIFAPITFPPASVLAFKTSKEELVGVGSGSLFSIDPSRLIIKRVLLSGHPFKVTNRSAVVRFMFFHREDIEWFKPIELRTRYGRRGHIKEPLGTHGHMKCVFDGGMKSQDTVLMPLYKRVFPKWTYDPVLPTFNVFDNPTSN